MRDAPARRLKTRIKVVQTLLAQAAVGRLDVRVIGRFAGRGSASGFGTTTVNFIRS